MKRLIPIIGVFLLPSVIAIADELDKPLLGPPVHVTVQVRYTTSFYEAKVELTAVNNHDFPVWIVVSDGNRLLPYRGNFSAEDWRGKGTVDKPDRIPFESREYNEGKGRTVIVTLYGVDYFQAFRLPAKGRLRFGGLRVWNKEPLRFVDVWEVRSLKVNSNVPLEEWLSSDVTSSEAVTIVTGMWKKDPSTPEGKKLEKEPVAKYRGEQVKSVKAEPLGRYVVPLPE